MSISLDRSNVKRSFLFSLLSCKPLFNCPVPCNPLNLSWPWSQASYPPAASIDSLWKLLLRVVLWSRQKPAPVSTLRALMPSPDTGTSHQPTLLGSQSWFSNCPLLVCWFNDVSFFLDACLDLSKWVFHSSFYIFLFWYLKVVFNTYLCQTWALLGTEDAIDGALAIVRLVF